MAHAGGRPSTYTKKIGDEICTRLANGESLLAISELDHMPPRITILQWLRSNMEFQEMYRQARQDQADFYAEEQTRIVDSATPADWLVKKLQADTRKWVAEKLYPRKYSARQIVQGDKDSDPIQHVHKVDLTKLSDDELELAIKLSHKARGLPPPIE